jgi:RNA-splicing ligase RtcB
MIEIKGKNNTAICFTDNLEKSAETQIREVCDLPEFSDCKIRIMPDVHSGAGCVIGTTMTIKDKIVPNMVGVDIGCGLESVKIKEKSVDFNALDKLIRAKVPSGRAVRDIEHKFNDEADLGSLRCKAHENSFQGGGRIDLGYARRSLGTLGGGNHFIEIDRSETGDLWLVVHSGSRHIGLETAGWYQRRALHSLNAAEPKEIEETINRLKAEGRKREIQETVRRLRAEKRVSPVPDHLAYVTGQFFDDYIHDMKIIQRFAVLNRLAMTEVIIREMGWTEEDRFTTIHNYVDTDNMILRKGSVSANKGERLIIPINMRDGSLICLGKGNEDWNFSAPHGAGRLLSRKTASKTLTMDKYAKEMEGVFTTSVSKDTLDESPMAYKPLEEILFHIGPAADLMERLRPVYNFKAGE